MSENVLSRLFDFGFNNIDLWRSEEMQLVQLMVPTESAHDTIAHLGDVGLLQFKDLNADKSAFQRNFANQVKRCDEMARRLRFFHDQVEKAGLSIKTRALLDKVYQFDELETKLEELEKEMLEMNSNTERLQRSYDELVELQLVLEKAGSFFDQTKFDVTPDSFGQPFGEAQDAPLLEAGAVDKAASRIGFVAGTIQQGKLNSFERLLFRATRGNMFLKHVDVGDLRDPATMESQRKHVFVIFFAGERSRQKVHKICDAFGANRYPFPEDVTRQRQMHGEVTSRLRELSTTNEAGERRRDALLVEIAGSLDEWTTLVRREKAIYHTMNKLSVDVTSKVLIAECWVPVGAKFQVQNVLRASAQQSSTQLSAILTPLPTHENPPTYYKTNKFTGCFQTIVEAYGVARYREVNPAVLTIMTFPFLFAVMFGDLGHGILMLGFACLMLYYEKQLIGKDLGDMFGLLFGGRYCILLMAVFSLYTGLLYNEFFSMPMGIFGDTRFKCFDQSAEANGAQLYDEAHLLHVHDIRDCQHEGGVVAFPLGASPYVFGVDPIWHGRKTELPFLNSLKMKMSILLGVAQMNMGIIMSLFNHLHFRDMLSLVWEFIPQMIFLNFIFGYLCVLIAAKWFTGSMADLYNVMIYLFLGVGKVNPGNEVFGGQQGLQTFLLIIAVLAVPCMLLPKPLILKKRHEAAQKARGQVELTSATYGHLDHDDEESRRPGTSHAAKPAANGGGDHGHGHGHGDHFEFGEVMVHQMIHTIEFVLGAVSNTASYLRLWALSLAHSQLSAVFYDRVLMGAIAKNNVLFMIIGFFVFAVATLGVLMVMESLSAFLHALRLHWVEYQNKFYRGDGYKFTPFSFETVLKSNEEQA